uniref:RRM domain-containing protein n=1 Tax=Globodera rostochiensis TaxID=31243 RepID=A0A914H201_GLORO
MVNPKKWSCISYGSVLLFGAHHWLLAFKWWMDTIWIHLGGVLGPKNAGPADWIRFKWLMILAALPARRLVRVVARAAVRRAVASKRLHIGNLDESVRRRDIEDVFGKFGRISDCWMASYPPFYAFVVFENNKDASACLKDLGNTAYIKGCRARVTVALPRNGATYRRGPPPPPRRYYDEEDSSRRRRRSRSRTRSPRRSRSRTPRRSRSRSPRRSRRHRSPSPKRERKEKDREEKDIEAKEKQPESKDNVNAKERSTGDVDKKRRTPPSSGGSSRSSSAS